MKRLSSKPHADTRLVHYLKKRILELRVRKSQLQIAIEAGFPRPNMLAMIKMGTSRLPLDRVPALAKALECDPATLFMMALEQKDDVLADIIRSIFGIMVTQNEIAWIEEIRKASGRSDPHLTTKAKKAIGAIFT